MTEKVTAETVSQEGIRLRSIEKTKIKVDSIRGHRFDMLNNFFKASADKGIDFNSLTEAQAWDLAVSYAEENVIGYVEGYYNGQDVELFEQYMGKGIDLWKYFMQNFAVWLYSLLTLPSDKSISIISLPDEVCKTCMVESIEKIGGYAPHCVLSDTTHDSMVLIYLHKQIELRAKYLEANKYLDSLPIIDIDNLPTDIPYGIDKNMVWLLFFQRLAAQHHNMEEVLNKLRDRQPETGSAPISYFFIWKDYTNLGNSKIEYDYFGLPVEEYGLSYHEESIMLKRVYFEKQSTIFPDATGEPLIRRSITCNVSMLRNPNIVALISLRTSFSQNPFATSDDYED